MGQTSKWKKSQLWVNILCQILFVIVTILNTLKLLHVTILIYIHGSEIFSKFRLQLVVYLSSILHGFCCRFQRLSLYDYYFSYFFLSLRNPCIFHLLNYRCHNKLFSLSASAGARTGSHGLVDQTVTSLEITESINLILKANR